MVKQTARVALILLASVALFACGTKKEKEKEEPQVQEEVQEEELEPEKKVVQEVEATLEITATLDNKPAAKAEIIVDGDELGATDNKGYFSDVIKKMPGATVQVAVIKEAPGYKVEPWEDSFTMQESLDKYPLEVTLKATKYFTIVVKEAGKAVKGAAIKIKGKKVATTDATGKFVYEYSTLPKKGVKIEVAKRGYIPWRKATKVKPGQTITASIFKPTVFIFKALTEEYGLTKGIEGVEVSRDGKVLDKKTNSEGLVKYVYNGKPGKKVWFTLSASGYTPAEWKTEVVLKGRRTIRRFFYSNTPKPVRVGIYGYASNVPDEDMESTLTRIKEAIGNNLFSHTVFEEVPSEVLKGEILREKLDIEEMTTAGWRKTHLIKTVDVIILGSIAKEDEELTIETKVFASDGKLILSMINGPRSGKSIKKAARKIVKNLLATFSFGEKKEDEKKEGDQYDESIKDVAQEIVRKIVEQFPFEGKIIAKEDDRYKVNLGVSDYKLQWGTEFAVMSPVPDKEGRVRKYDEIATLKINKMAETASWGNAIGIKAGEEVRVGHKVVRRIFKEKEDQVAQKSFTLLAKGGVPPDVGILGGVNIYLNDKWVGTTGADGKVTVPVRVGKKYDLVLYRHGYEQLYEKLRVEEDQEQKEFILNINNSLFKVESQPSRAKVIVDGKEIGTTPLLEGEQVNFGFRTVRLKASDNYRDWEDVMEFNQKVVDRTGKNKIVLYKDYIKLAKRAKQDGKIDVAISTYKKAGKEHPDYSEARHSLAQLYMDEKNDYGSAVREFENVLSLPENKQLIYKQYAVTYTNLGHAYYELGNGFINKDKKTSAKNFAKALKNLDIAKQNTRFFPTRHYAEALHDTYYYKAISYHKLYFITRKAVLLDKADFAWRDYFDFFPQELEDDKAFVQLRDSAEKRWAQIRDLK